jgi:hypothetical protein
VREMLARRARRGGPAPPTLAKQHEGLALLRSARSSCSEAARGDVVARASREAT